MNREQELVQEFHEKYGCKISNKPHVLDPEAFTLRFSLIHEECTELLSAQRKKDLVSFADALGDILFVVYGTAVAAGIDMQPIFDEIARSNLTKDGGGKDGGGKVMKGPNYCPPDIATIIDQQLAA